MPIKTDQWKKDFIYLTYQLEDSLEISKIVNLSIHTIHNTASKMNLKKISKYINPKDKFGCLQIIGLDTSRRNNRNLYKCQCTCGNIIKKTSYDLFNNYNVNCNCKIKNDDIDKIINMYKNNYSLNKIAKKYKIDYKKVKNILLENNILIKLNNSIIQDGIPGTIWGQMLRGAKQRKLDVTITQKYIMDILISQNWKCALSGELLTFPKSSKNKSNFTASIDRIDSSKGYIAGNVQWVHKKVNIMKMNMSDKIFKEWCKKIVNFSKV